MVSDHFAFSNVSFLHTYYIIILLFVLYSTLATNPVTSEGIPKIRGLTLKNSEPSKNNYFQANIFLPDDNWTVCFWWKFEDYEANSQPLISMATDGESLSSIGCHTYVK